MSLPNAEVRCQGCDYQGYIVRRPITLEYVLPDGEVVQSYRDIAWSSSCEGITNAEQAIDIESIRARLHSLPPKRVGFLARLLGIGGDPDADERRRLEAKLRLAQLRRSPPRCLHCGRTTVVPLRFDHNGISDTVHTCGSHFFVLPQDSDAPRFMYRPEVILLTPDGERL